ncbi:TIGR00270 family protein [Methanothermococcus sp. SCGC AD-155-C09]|nr:TIGR00270 family protein [Methanothermococcus sp. SCGC AD-155-C09]
MQCELCGKEDKKLTTVRIEGVEMQVCSECSKYGVIPKTYSKKPKPRGIIKTKPSNKKTTSYIRPRRDIFDNLKTIVEDYGNIIKEAREKKGMSIKDLAKKVGIKESTLHKIERNELEPEEKYISKLERELNIVLYEEGDQEYNNTISNEEITLGHFIKVKKK